MMERVASARPWRLLLDFDGTITWRDADFEIADALLPPGRERAYEPLARRYERLELSLVAYFHAYLELLGATPEQIRRQAEQVAVRPGLGELLATCDALGLEVVVVSEGIDLYVEPILAAAGFAHAAVSCNRAVYSRGSGGNGADGAGWQVRPPADGEPCERCLNCKGVHARRARAAGQRVAIVGNGASDLCGARAADLVIARDTLARHCDAEGIPYRPWTTFEHVAAALRAACG
jgi:2,3-diketo-5-methylthio-1-phosphopentane phosphatase